MGILNWWWTIYTPPKFEVTPTKLQEPLAEPKTPPTVIDYHIVIILYKYVDI
jgi:hypothetical protein